MRRHDPVLVNEVVEYVPEHATSIFDGTLGHGGHTAAIIAHLQSLQGVATSSLKVIGIDRDTQMIEKAQAFLTPFIDAVNIVHASYAEFTKIVKDSGQATFDFMLLDLGVNMDHFKEADRGFSLKLDGPLDMRYDTSEGTPVGSWLRNTKFDELKMTLEKYTDFGERYVKQMTESLWHESKRKAFETTQEIRDRARDQGINDKKLAVIFQALRIHINDELDQLHVFLEKFTAYLAPGGRCAIITYHSGEDRIVKNAFKDLESKGEGTVLTKKVIKPNYKEVKKNRAARSAKMRVFERTSE